MTTKHGDQVSNDKELSWRQTDATSSNPRLNGRGFHLRIREQSVLVLWWSFGFVAREGGIEGGCFIVKVGAPPQARYTSRSARTWAQQLARGPDDLRVGPIGGGLGGLPTMPPVGFSCASRG